MTTDEYADIFSEAEVYLETKVEDETVLIYIIEDSSIYIKFNSGISFCYQPTLEDTFSGEDDIELTISYYQPCDGDYTVDCEVTISDPISYIENLSNGNSYTEEDVTLQMVKNLPSDNIIVWYGHGGYSKSTGSYVIMATREEDYVGDAPFEKLKDLIKDNLTTAYVEDDEYAHIAFTAGFVNEYCGDLTNDIIFLSCCKGGMDTRLADAFISCGASAVLCFTNSVYCSYAELIIDGMLLHMMYAWPESELFFTMEQALEFVTDKYGENDEIWFQNESSSGSSLTINGAEPLLVVSPLTGDVAVENVDLYLSTETGSLSGTVWYYYEEENIGPAASAIVSLYQDGDLYRSVYTDENGEYSIPILPVGSYDIVFSMEGYSNYYLDNTGVYQDRATVADGYFLKLPVWDGSVAESYAGGDGSKEDPYQISNGAELALMAQDIKTGKNSTACFVLTSDLLLNDLTDWTEWIESPPENIFPGIGRNTYPEKYFTGTFDGQGHTIYGMYSSTGMFVCIHGGVTIQNLYLDACVVDGTTTGTAISYESLGGMISEIDTRYINSSDVLIRCCSFNGIVKGSDTYGTVGGLIGSVTLGTNFELEYCKSNATVSGKRVGGLLGTLSTEKTSEDERNISITYCENYGNVEGVSSAGGLIDEISLGSGAGVTTRIFCCRNTGEITAAGSLKSGGGIAGYVGVGGNQYISISSCVNSGNGGVIYDWLISSGGTLNLYNNYYREGSAAYDTQTQRPYSEDITTSYLIRLEEGEFRNFCLPLYSDAEEALDTGNYVKCNGKIYYVGFSNRIFRANYDGTQEVAIAEMGRQEYGVDGNFICYQNKDYQLVLYNVETGEIEIIEEDADDVSAYLLGMKEGYVYYSWPYSTSIVKYSIENKTKEEIKLNGISGDSPSLSMQSYGFCLAYYSIDAATYETSITYNFYTFEGELFRQIFGMDLGDDINSEMVDGTVIIYGGGSFEIYDPETDAINEQYDVQDIEVSYINAIDDKFIHFVGKNEKYYLVNRENGSVESFG